MDEYIKSLIIIFAVLGALGVVLAIIRTMGRRIGVGAFQKGKRSLFLEEHISLGPKRGASVVRYDNRRYLLGVTDHQITLLSVLQPKVPAVSSSSDNDNSLEKKWKEAKNVGIGRA